MSAGGYEKSDVNIVRLLVVAIAPVATVIGGIFGVDAYFQYLQIQEETVKTSQVDARWIERQRVDQERLTHYGIVDAQKGIYAIPIERAMQLLAQDGQGGQ